MDCIALIVDDDQPTLLFLEQVLRPLALRVVKAEDGGQAISVLEDATPAVVFLDMLMPSISGLDVLDYIARTPRLHNMLVVVVSAHRHFEPSPALNRVNSYLVKPIRPKDIREAAQYALSRQAPH